MPHPLHVDIFIPCFVDQMYPEIGFSMVKVLRALGCEVHYNTEQTCCGQPAYNAGFFKEAADVASKFVSDFSRSNARYIITPSASCAGMIRNGYNELLADNSNRMELKQVQKNTFEFVEFIVKVLQVDHIPGVVFPHVITYHDSCSALRELGLKNEPRQLLEAVEGLQLVEMARTETCCGFGGTFAVKFEAISVGMAEQKVLDAMSTGAEYMVSTDVSCLMHVDGYIQKNKLPLKTMHIAELLATGMS